LSKAVLHPLLESLFHSRWKEPCFQVAQEDEQTLDQTEIYQCIEEVERIVEKPAQIVDARQPVDLDELFFEHLLPELLYLGDLCVEAMSPYIEAISLIG